MLELNFGGLSWPYEDLYLFAINHNYCVGNYTHVGLFVNCRLVSIIFHLCGQIFVCSRLFYYSTNHQYRVLSFNISVLRTTLRIIANAPNSRCWALDW